MPSATYEVFLRAMRERKPITCIYQGRRREICPILLGRTGLEEKSLAFQFGGATSEGPIAPPGDWKCLRLKDVRDVVLCDGPWRSGDRHSTGQTCMKMVEYDVNPLSPYNPAFTLRSFGPNPLKIGQKTPFLLGNSSQMKYTVRSGFRP